MIYGKTAPVPSPFEGVLDFIVDVPDKRPIRVLQLTDMQVIDASQQRFPTRLNEKEIVCWQPENVGVELLDHIRSVCAQTRPDLIFITGDIVYGEFDDSGRSFELFCDFMDSLDIPWAPIFGNHDNESKKGVLWQCARFAAAKNCLFARGNVHGNSNYTVGITQGGRLVRVLYLTDSNCCGGTDDPAVFRYLGFHEDQVAWLAEKGTAVGRISSAPGFFACHVPPTEFHTASVEKGYPADQATAYVIGVNVPARDGDMGCKREHISCFSAPAGFRDALAACRVDGAFTGHCHAINTSVLWQGIRWTFGLKTGQYDYHIPGHMGGTLITLNPDAAPGALPDQTERAPFIVRHVPALTLYGPFPKGT